MEITRFKRISRLVSTFAFLFLLFAILSPVQSKGMKSVLVSNSTVEVEAADSSAALPAIEAEDILSEEVLASSDSAADSAAITGTAPVVIPPAAPAAPAAPAVTSVPSAMPPANQIQGPMQPQNVCVSCCECGEVVVVPVRSRKTLAENVSALTCFNCRTNGSYKFPVPRQYTYFWPGIYSQKTMTEYVAPYQGLKLRSPAEVFDGAQAEGDEE